MLSQNLGAVPVQRIEQSPADQRLCENVIEARLGGLAQQERGLAHVLRRAVALRVRRAEREQRGHVALLGRALEQARRARESGSARA